MKKMITVLVCVSVLGGLNVFASGKTDSVEPSIHMKNGQQFTSANVSDNDNVKNKGEYDVYNPFDLIGACYKGSSERVVKEILMNDDFLDHAGDYSCDVEAKLSSDERVIEYTCTDNDTPNKSFKILPCPKEMTY